MADDPYVYPGTRILKNKLDIRDAETLDFAERRFSTFRARQGIPQGDFDLRHLKAIHHHLLQDIYDWAGKIRTVEISKGESQFQFRQYIETGMADVHGRLVRAGFLRHMDRSAFAAEAARIIGDVNYVHPFREGNGRTQLQYLKQLANQAGHRLDLTKIDPAGWIEASKQAHHSRYDLMAGIIDKALHLS
jgi:cell filamentation protein